MTVEVSPIEARWGVNAFFVFDPAGHRIEFWSVDVAGNVETPHKIASFTVTGYLIEYTAPGVDVLSTYRGGGYSTM